jgi:hypothetical protein
MEAAVMNENWTQVLTEQISLGNTETARYAVRKTRSATNWGRSWRDIIGSVEIEHRVSMSELRIAIDHGASTTNSDITANGDIGR